jgi:transcription antitermination factor NusA-like protein
VGVSTIVKIPLDHICVKTGVLCPRCQSLVDSGKVDRKEIPVMKTLIELEENNKEFRFLKNIKYVKTIWIDNLAVLIIKSSSSNPHQLKKLAKTLSERLNTRFQVIEQTKDLKKLASQLLSPARVMGVNMIWLPDGTIEYVIRVSRYDQRLLPSKTEILEQALSKVLNSPARIRLD